MQKLKLLLDEVFIFPSSERMNGLFYYTSYFAVEPNNHGAYFQDMYDG